MAEYHHISQAAEVLVDIKVGDITYFISICLIDKIGEGTMPESYHRDKKYQSLDMVGDVEVNLEKKQR